MLESENFLSTALFLSGLGLLAVILLRRSFRYFKRRKKDNRAIAEVARPDGKKRQPLLDAPGSLQRWEVEMYEIARDLKGELNSKIGVLQQLTISAREQAERLEEALARAEALESPIAEHEKKEK